MEKIREIIIEGEGKQLKESIEDKFSYRELAEKFHLYDTTIKQYLKNRVITNKKFVNQIEEIFQMKYNEIVVPVETQINNYILSIRDNIRYYNQIEDEKIVNMIYDLALKYTDLYHQLIAQGNIARHKFNVGFEYEANRITKEIISISQEHDFTQLIIYYNVHLASMQLSNDIKHSIKTLENIRCLLKDETSYINLYIYNYLYGIILNRLGKSKDAREHFEEALKYTKDDITEAGCLTNIGLTYYSEGKYKTALIWNQKALEKTQSIKEIRSAVLNNIANIYLKKGELERARWYLEKAMENLQEESDIHRKVSIYDTYLEINEEESSNLIDDLLSLLDKKVAIIGHQHYLVNSVKKLFVHFVENEELDNIKKLLDQLVDYSEKWQKQKAVMGLKEIIADIYIYLRKGGIDYEEISQDTTCYHDF